MAIPETAGGILHGKVAYIVPASGRAVLGACPHVFPGAGAYPVPAAETIKRAVGQILRPIANTIPAYHAVVWAIVRVFREGVAVMVPAGAVIGAEGHGLARVTGAVIVAGRAIAGAGSVILGRFTVPIVIACGARVQGNIVARRPLLEPAPFIRCFRWQENIGIGRGIVTVALDRYLFGDIPGEVIAVLLIVLNDLAGGEDHGGKGWRKESDA